MMIESSFLLPVGLIIDNRYRLLSHLRSGGFGRIYLAEDLCCQQQKCILTQITGQEENSEDFSKAEALYFTLYQLKHPQIPQVRSMLRVRIREQESLFLVQEYIEGKSYAELLQEKKRFNETEIIQLLFDTLPILEYLHAQNIVHQNISPENLVQHNSDRKTVLINFDSIQFATDDRLKSNLSYVSNIIQPQAKTNKTQIQSDRAANIKNDLYALAVTALVLLTGKQPQELYDIYRANWKWQEAIKVSANFGSVLAKMLAQNANYRYSSATEVIEALKQFSSPIALEFLMPTINRPLQESNNSIAKEIPTKIVNQPLQQSNNLSAKELTATQVTQPLLVNNLAGDRETTAATVNQSLPKTNSSTSRDITSTIPTLVIAPGNKSNATLNTTPITNEVTTSSEQPTQQIIPKNNKIMSFFKAIFVSVTIVLLPAMITFHLVKQTNWQPEPEFFSKLLELFKLDETNNTEIGNIDPSEIDRRIQALNNPSSFYEKVDRSLYAKHPELRGRPLTNNPEDRKLRDEWYKIAADFLEK
jgi:serine/threonine-protein kinase